MSGSSQALSFLITMYACTSSDFLDSDRCLSDLQMCCGCNGAIDAYEIAIDLVSLDEQKIIIVDGQSG